VQTVSDHITAVDVKAIGPSETSAWDDYVARHVSDALFFRADWDKPFQTYRLTVERLAAFRDGTIVGVLPLVHQRSLLFGKHMVSLPWFDTCGLLADDVESRDGLLAEAVNRAAQRGVDEVQLRQREPAEISDYVRTDKVLMQLELPATGEELWDGFSPKVRNQIRKGQKAGVTVESGGRELLDDFFNVYSVNMRDLGSPAHSRRFFQAVLDAFPEEATVHVARLEGTAIGGGFTMSNGAAWEIPWASSLRTYNKLCINHVMYWHMLEQACIAGATSFRFGRSTPGSGTFKFKKQWGAQPVNLYWYLLPAKPGMVPDMSPPKESYGKAAQIWQKLPVWLTRIIGPQIIRKVA